MTVCRNRAYGVLNLPVITEVAKEQGIRPSRPLSIAVVASQIAITASPISAAVVFFAGILEPLGVSYLTPAGDLYSGYPDCRHAYRHRL
jgi:anaerobic C4-dicarboxylate transporter